MIQYNGLTLAYIGDAYFELAVRNYLLDKGITKVNDLHTNAILYTNANSQAKIARKLIKDFYSDNEINIYKRGRNSNSTHKPKNSDVITYNTSTGFEAVIGYLYLDSQFDRLDKLLKKSFSIIEKL